MVDPNARLALQGFSTAYTPLKDMVVYFRTRASFIRRTERNLQKLTLAIATLKSSKETIDRISNRSVSKEKTDEYDVSLALYESLEQKYINFLIEYQELHGDSGSTVEVLNTSSLSNVIVSLKDTESSIWTWKFRKRATLSKRVVELYDDVSKLITRLDEKNMTREKKRELVQVDYDICFLPHLNMYVDEILSYLKCEENERVGNLECTKIKRIGVLGGVGVGKTTVMKMVKNQLAASQSSGGNGKLIVIWIDCHDRKLEAIQNEIMVQLRIDKDKTESVYLNAEYISKWLQEKTYVLFMDHVSSIIDIHNLGIHKEHPHGKVVIATRHRTVINQMKTDVEAEIRKLPEEDAFKLFEYICGPIGHDTRIKPLAEVIVQLCGGLPLVIELVANYLKNQKDEGFWHVVKRELQSHTGSELLELQGVGQAYKMFYNGLKDYMKKCSLFGALFPIKYKIHKSYLVECWQAEGFFEDIEDIESLRGARCEGTRVLIELKTRFLMESCSDEHVQMPAYYRKVALAQDFPDEEKSKMWVGDLMNQFPGKESWSTTKRMSLIKQSIVPSAVGASRSVTRMLNSPETADGSNISELKISTLLLQSIEGLNELDDDFFSRMKNLRVLDLHRTGIESLPSSIGDLEKLISLYLNECLNLAMLPPEMEKLEKLELLDIRRTSINPWLPQQIARMTGLRCLRVTFDVKGCSSSWKRKEVEVTTPWDIISRLNVLEELVIETNICSENWINIADKIVDVLVNLVQLTTLHFNFHSLESLQKFIRGSSSWNNTSTKWDIRTFQSFRFFVGCTKVLHPYGSYICGVSAERHLRLSSIDKENSSFDLKVLEQASAFELVGNSNAKSLNEFNLADMGTLKVCVIEDCNNVESVIDMDEMNNNPIERTSGIGILQNLEKLILYNLQSLNCIWRGTFLPQSLLSLTILILSDCPELTGITTSQIWLLLKKIVIIRCRKLTQLSMTRDNAKNLTFIECEASWWTRLRLGDEDKRHFARFCHFIHQENNTALHITYEGEASSSMICQEITIDEHAEDRADDNKVLEVNSLAKNDEQLSEEVLDSQGKCFPWPKSKKLRVKPKSKGKDQAEPSKAADSWVADSEELVSNKGGIKISEIKDDKSIDTSKEVVVFQGNGVTTNMDTKADTSGEMPDNVEHSEIMNHPTNDEKGNYLGDRLSNDGAGSGTEGSPEGMPGNVEISEIMTPPTNNSNGNFFGDLLSKEGVGNGTEGTPEGVLVM